jgi:soluble cytochrome b562
MLLDNVKASERVRDVVMKAVVWLEMKDFPNEAQRLDDAVQSMREAVFACRQAMAAHGPSKAQDVPEVRGLRDAWVAAVENLRTVVEQVMADVPYEVWEGIDG